MAYTDAQRPQPYPMAQQPNGAGYVVPGVPLYPDQPQYAPYAGPPGSSPTTLFQPINSWRSDLFDCIEEPFHLDECLDVWCCRWCKMGHMHYRLERGHAGMDPLVCSAIMCADCWTGGCASPVMTWVLRTAILKRYLIRETPLETMCISWCCYPCALCQQSREMIMQNEPCGGPCSGIVSNPPSSAVMGGAVGDYRTI
jgi:Cys-rich protein (TIGR01571 family)